jgi:hypothetical protein
MPAPYTKSAVCCKVEACLDRLISARPNLASSFSKRRWIQYVPWHSIKGLR